jgi:hypothetical protein
MIIDATTHCTQFDSTPLTLAELDEAVCDFIGDHDGARWSARFVVRDNTLIATVGDESSVWTLSPAALAVAKATIVRYLAEFRVLESQESERRLPQPAAIHLS